MRQELDEQLCKTYPKLFRDRYAPMTETCMCWGFECGDGWFNIINALCSNIQHHIDWREKQRQAVIQHNEMVTAGLAGDLEALDERYGQFNNAEKYIQDALEEGPRLVPDPIPQVVVMQVKEKFGTLRFYYTGGDDEISGMVRMAESLSAVTCESCGNPGEMWPKQDGEGIRGWIHTHCQACEDKRNKEYANAV